MTSVNSPQPAGTKRVHPSDESPAAQPHPEPDKHSIESPPKLLTTVAATSAFRNVSACNRCRIRKNRCDQQLPACQACEKAKQRCVGFDPITRQEIPRSYVFFLESRLAHFESLLVANNIDFEAPDAFEDGASTDRVRNLVHAGATEVNPETHPAQTIPSRPSKMRPPAPINEDAKINNIVSEIGMVSVQGASDRRYLGSTSGISFARVVLSAIKSSTPGLASDKPGSKLNRSTSSAAVTGGSSIRDSYFGLSTKPTFKEAPFPEKELAFRLVTLYFEHANPQIPILHRIEFMQLFERVYTSSPTNRTARELYLLNIVFAIGSGVFLGSSDSDADSAETVESPPKRAKLANQQAQPEEYHASAIVHLGAMLGSSSSGDGNERSVDDLGELQAVLLLADFALLRPVAPGLWYIVGVAMRLAVDMGLHYEDGLGLDGPAGESSHIIRRPRRRNTDSNERGKREWARDMRRRLWWCTYSFDRLVSTCVGRPFGITDAVITTEFPSLLEDQYITRTGFLEQAAPQEPSYKRVTHHYIRLRLLQSEILQVLQYQQAQQARSQGANLENYYIHKDVGSPFLIKHPDFRSWRSHVDQRLWEWKESAPQRRETGVAFNPQFLELNYWLAVLMLYRNSLSVPEPFASELSPTGEVSTPTSPPMEDKDDQDLVFLKCAEAGQKTLRIYRHLHMHKLVNYTYLSTHHLFMAGISFLYALWHSPAVRSRLTIDDFDFTVLSATSVLGDLLEKCPPALACRDAFERMSKATIQMCMNTPGYQLGSPAESAQLDRSKGTSNPDYMAVDSKKSDPYQPPRQNTLNKRPPPQFDMDLHELFPEDLDMGTRPSSTLVRSHRKRQMQSRYGNHNRTSLDLLKRTPGTTTTTTQRIRDLNQQFPQPQLSPHNSNSGDSPSTFFGVNQNSYNPDFMSNVPGMEFLNQISNDNPNPNPNLHHQQPEYSPRSLAATIHNTALGNSPSMGLTYDGTTGLSTNNQTTATAMSYDDFDYESQFGGAPDFNFGIGMGLDFNLMGQTHGGSGSWDDSNAGAGAGGGAGGGGFDLDGFFFGGNGA